MKPVVFAVAIVSLVGYVASVQYPFATCSSNEVLVPSPPCCEPTCDCDCEQSSCKQLLVYQPTCVCMKGFVRLDNKCVPKTCCPAPETYETQPPYETTTCAPAYQPPVYQPPVYQPPVYQPPVYQPCETTTPPCAYEQPQYQPPAYQPPAHQPPVYQPPVYQPPAYEPCETTKPPCAYEQPPYHPPAYQPPVYEPPVYQPPVYQPCDTTPAPCYTTPAPCYTTPAPCYTTPAPCYTTPAPSYTTPAPYEPPKTCNACEELVLTQTCCEPTCDNDCSGVQCNPLLLVQEPTCACRPGLVRYQGHCVEPSNCPKYRLYVPKTVSCACNSNKVTVSTKPFCKRSDRAMRFTGFTLTVVGSIALILLTVAVGSHGETFPLVNYGESKEKNLCSPYEVLKPSEPCCEPTCDDDCLHAICRRAPDAVPVPTCVCRQGYVRHNGACIRKESCPSPNAGPITTYDSYLPRSYYPTPRPSRLRSCGPNEKLTHCKPSCVPTCDNDCTGVKQPEVCIPETSCVCKDGYVRHNGRCIKRCDCPKRNPFQRRPVSGEYIDFEVVSLEGMKSDEDFNYRPQAEYRMSKYPYSGYGQARKPPMAPVYLRTVTSAPNSASASYERTTTEKPALYPPLCACHSSKKMYTPLQAPRLDETASFESTEEDSDIVPYAPPPSVCPYGRTSSTGLFPPTTTASSAGQFYVPRKTIPAPPAAHRCDCNEPVDHFYASGQVASGQQSSAAQDEPRTPTIWPPVSCYCTRCGFKPKN
uniref:EGF-like domain-containing protein n=1 Tax=Anopheles farauti TaxID=69004 RepID=A0A182QZK5_9DIPT